MKYFVYTDKGVEYFKLKSYLVEFPNPTIALEGDGIDVYSEEETLTNKTWMGKTVYRKIITIDGIKTKKYTVCDSVKNIDMLIHSEVIRDSREGGEGVCDLDNIFYVYSGKSSDDVIEYWTESKYTDATFYITIEYTKNKNSTL